MTNHTDTAALRELLAREKRAQHRLSMPGEPAWHIEEAEQENARVALSFAAVNALPSLLDQIDTLTAAATELAEVKASMAYRHSLIGRTEARCAKLAKALKQIASCNSHFPGDVVSIARQALGVPDVE